MIKKILLTVGLLSSTVFANNFNIDSILKEGVVLKQDKSNSFDIVMNTNKPLTVGENEINIYVFKNGEIVNGQSKLKIFMPEMPGMPYMEEEEIGIIKDGLSKIKINFSMSGTWQFNLKIKTDKGIEKITGNFNL